MRMNFVQDATAKIEGLLDVNRDFCRKQIGQKSPQMPPPNCAVLPKGNAPDSAVQYAMPNRATFLGNDQTGSRAFGDLSRGHDCLFFLGNTAQFGGSICGEPSSNTQVKPKIHA